MRSNLKLTGRGRLWRLAALAGMQLRRSRCGCFRLLAMQQPGMHPSRPCSNQVCTPAGDAATRNAPQQAMQQPDVHPSRPSQSKIVLQTCVASTASCYIVGSIVPNNAWLPDS
eukprot:365143-Chlamydomonas_euryale.AAC.6